MGDYVDPLPNVPLSHEAPQEFCHQAIFLLENFSDFLLPWLFTLIELNHPLQFSILIDDFPFVEKRRVGR